MLGGIRSTAMSLVVIAAFLLARPARAQRAADQEDAELKEQILSVFHLARTSPTQTGLSLDDSGTPLVVRMGGIALLPAGSAVLCPVTFNNGAWQPPDKACVAEKHGYSLEVGTRVYLYGLTVSRANDTVVLEVLARKISGDTPDEPRYFKALLGIQYPKDYLRTADPGQVEDVIAQVLAIYNPSQDAQQAQQTSLAGALTNSDIIKMTKAGLPDSVILAKIKSSDCNFDTTTDVLIKMKEAGVSGPVLQAVVEAMTTGNTAPASGAGATASPDAAEAQPGTAAAPVCSEYDSCMKTGAARLALSQWADALGRFQAASQFDPSKGEAWAGMGDAYFQMGQYDDAARAWDKALLLGATITAPVCHAGALCGDTGTFQLSAKEVCFLNRKGEKELAAVPSEVTSEGPVFASLGGGNPAYYLNVKFKKNWRFYYQPKSERCRLNLICSESGVTQQSMFAHYVHSTLVRMAAGEFGPPSGKP